MSGQFLLPCGKRFAYGMSGQYGKHRLIDGGIELYGGLERGMRAAVENFQDHVWRMVTERGDTGRDTGFALGDENMHEIERQRLELMGNRIHQKFEYYERHRLVTIDMVHRKPGQLLEKHLLVQQFLLLQASIRNLAVKP